MTEEANETNEESALKFILDHTPFGLMKDTVNSIKPIIHKFDTKPALKNILQSYEEDHFKQVPLENDKLIISKINKDKDNFYYDQTKKYKLLINPLSENFEKLEKIDTPNPLQAKFNKAILSYKERFYDKDATSINVSYNTVNNTQWKITILISSHIVSEPSSISGEWLSSYSIVNNPDNDEWTIDGNVKIHTYFYEDCNFQLQNNKELKPIKSSFKKENNDEEKITTIIKHVEDFENNILNEVSKVFNNLYTDCIKPFRKKIIYTGKKMKWTEIQDSFDE